MDDPKEGGLLTPNRRDWTTYQFCKITLHCVFIFAFIYYHINIRFSIKYGNLLTAVNCYIGITSSFTKVYLHRGHICFFFAIESKLHPLPPCSRLVSWYWRPWLRQGSDNTTFLQLESSLQPWHHRYLSNTICRTSESNLWP